MGLAEPTEDQFFGSFLAPFFALIAHSITDLDKMDAFKTILKAMRDGNEDCDGAATYSDITRWLYGKAAEQMDRAQRADFRRETERLWQAALLGEQ